MKEPIRILLLASDPEDRGRLRLGSELQSIQDEIRRGRLADRFELDRHLSPGIGDMTRAIHDFRPHILHFCGHGSVEGDLCFEDASGKAQSVSPENLERFFSLVAGEVDCVVLNSCYSERQAEVITKYIPYVVGMKEVVSDEAAIRFAVGFYQALAGQRSISQAFEFGCVLVETAGEGELLQAVLKVAPNADRKLVGLYGERARQAETAPATTPPPAPPRHAPANQIGSISAGRDVDVLGGNSRIAKSNITSPTQGTGDE